MLVLLFAAEQGDVRLVGTLDGTRGRLEIYRDGSDWGTVCDDRFGEIDATVVCRQLEYSGGTARYEVYLTASSNTSIYMDEVACSGSETSLSDCSFDGWGVHDCEHSEDVGVDCTAPSTGGFKKSKRAYA